MDVWKRVATEEQQIRVTRVDPKGDFCVAVRIAELHKSGSTATSAYELASAAFQIGIVLASAAVITEMIGLAWLAGLIGAGGLVMLGLGLFAPHFLPLA